MVTSATKRFPAASKAGSCGFSSGLEANCLYVPDGSNCAIFPVSATYRLPPENRSYFAGPTVSTTFFARSCMEASSMMKCASQTGFPATSTVHVAPST